MNKSSSHNNIMFNQKDLKKTNSISQINCFNKPTCLNTNSSIKSTNKIKYQESYKPCSNKFNILRKQSNLKLNEIESMISSLSSNNFLKSNCEKNNIEEKLETQLNINNSISLNNSQYINDSILNVPLIDNKYTSNSNNSNIKNHINKSKSNRKRLKIESNYEEYNNTFNDLAKEMKKKEEIMHNKFLNLKSNSSSIFKSLKTFDIKNNQAQKRILNSNFEKNSTSKLQFKININKNSLRLLQVTNEKGFHNRNKASDNKDTQTSHTSIHGSKLREDDELQLFKSNKEFHRITMNTLFNGKNILKNYKNQYNNFIYDVGNNLSKKDKARIQDGKGFNTFYLKNSKNYREVKDFDLSISKKNIIRNAHFLRNERNINKLKTIEESLLKIDENLVNDFIRNHEKDNYIKRNEDNVDNADNHGKLLDEESYISNTSNNKTKNIFDNKLDISYHSNNDDILSNKDNNQCNDGNDDEFLILKDLEDLNKNSNNSKKINSLIFNSKFPKNKNEKGNIDVNINGKEHSNLISLRTSRSKTFFNHLPINIFNSNEINRLYTNTDEKEIKKEQKRSNKNIKFKENTCECELKEKININDNASILKSKKKNNLKKSRNNRNKNSHDNYNISNTEKNDHLEKRKSRVSFYLAKNKEDKDSNEIKNNDNNDNYDNNNLNEEEDFSVMNNKDPRKIRSKRKKTFLVGSKSNFHKYNSLLMEYTNKNITDNNDNNNINDMDVTSLHYKNHSSWTSNDNNMLFSTKLNTETNSQLNNLNTNNNDVKSFQRNQIKQESKNGLNNTFTTIYSNLDNRNILELEKLNQPDKNHNKINKAKADFLQIDDSILSIKLSDNKYESSLYKTKPFIKQKTSVSKFFKANNQSNNKSSFNNMIPSILNKSKTKVFENKTNKINNRNRKEIQYSYENEKLLESKIISIIENTKEKYDIIMRNIEKERLRHIHNNVLNTKFLENITNNKKDLKLSNLKKTFLSDLNKIDAKKSLINDKLIELLNQENNIPVYLRTASCSNFKVNNQCLATNENIFNKTKTRNFANTTDSNMKLHAKIESNNSINTYKSLASVKSDKTKGDFKNKHTNIRDVKVSKIIGNSKISESEKRNNLSKYRDHDISVNENLNINNELSTNSDAFNGNKKVINRQSGYLKNIVNLKNFISNSYNFKRIEEIENEAEDLIVNEIKKSNNSLTMTNNETNTNNNKKISITITNKDKNINNYDSEANNKTSYKNFRNSNKNNSTIISNNLSNKDMLNYSSRFFNHKSSKKLDSNAKKHLSFNNSNANYINSNNYLSIINNKRSEKQLNEFVQIFMKLNNSNNIADRKSSKEKVIKAFQNFYYLNDDENEKNFIKRNHNV